MPVGCRITGTFIRILIFDDVRTFFISLYCLIHRPTRWRPHADDGHARRRGRGIAGDDGAGQGSGLHDEAHDHAPGREAEASRVSAPYMSSFLRTRLLSVIPLAERNEQKPTGSLTQQCLRCACKLA